jgi:uncharacterized membrane protein
MVSERPMMPVSQAPSAVPKDMRDLRRTVVAMTIGIAVTLVTSIWFRITEALSIGMLIAMGHDLLRFGRVGMGMDAEHTRRLFASIHPDKGRLLRRTVVFTFVSMTVLILCIYDIKHVPGSLPSSLRVSLFFAALFTAWLELHIGFALYYAKVYYSLNRTPSASGDSPQGFIFPGTDEPLFSDFLYVAYVVALTFAMSDVDLEDGLIRRVVLSQALISFLFYSTIFSVITNLMMN